MIAVIFLLFHLVRGQEETVEKPSVTYKPALQSGDAFLRTKASLLIGLLEYFSFEEKAGIISVLYVGNDDDALLSQILSISSMKTIAGKKPVIYRISESGGIKSMPQVVIVSSSGIPLLASVKKSMNLKKSLVIYEGNVIHNEDLDIGIAFNTAQPKIQLRKSKIEKKGIQIAGKLLTFKQTQIIE